MGFWDSLSGFGQQIPSYQMVQGLTGQGQYGQQTGDLVSQLQALAAGRGPSLADAQTRRNLQQNIAGSQALMASAPASQQAMSTRLGFQNQAQMGAQAAEAGTLARLQEQADARQQLAQLLAQLQNQPSQGQRLLGAASGVAQTAALASDRRLKTNVKDGAAATDRLLAVLSPKSFRYKDKKYGEGQRLGIMAQDVEKAAPKPPRMPRSSSPP